MLPLTLGIAVRIVATSTYHDGADFHYDSYSYLDNARHLTPDIWHPIAYPVVLRLLSLLGPIALVPIVQGAFGLAAGVLVYVLGRRFGLSDRWSAVAAAPILLDAWQIAVEQTVMSEAFFELLLMTGLVLLLGNKTPSLWQSVAGGSALSVACLTRTAALPLMALTLAFMSVRRVPTRRVVAAAAFSSLPLVIYAGAFSATFGPFALSGLNGRAAYGETATFVNCALMADTPTNRMLCPKTPLPERAGNNQYTWDSSSPLNHLDLSARGRTPRTLELNRRAAAFAKEVIQNQPLDYLRYVADATARYFTVGRKARLEDYPQVAWQFLAVRQPAAVYDVSLGVRGFDGDRVAATSPLPLTADLLRSYQKIVFTPGPALALAALLGLGTVFTRRRHLEAGFLSLGGLSLLTMPSLAAGFDYRYLLPALLLLPLAGALAVCDIKQRTQGRNSTRISQTGALGAFLILLLFLNYGRAGVMPASKVTAQRTAPATESVALARGLKVAIGPPRVNYAECRRSTPGKLRWSWSYSIYVTVQSAGKPRLVQGASLSLQGPTGPEQQPSNFYLTSDNIKERDVPLIISSSTPLLKASGTFLVPYATGVIRWADSTGGGVAQWPLMAHAADLPQAGSRCTERNQRIDRDSPGVSVGP